MCSPFYSARDQGGPKICRSLQRTSLRVFSTPTLPNGKLHPPTLPPPHGFCVRPKSRLFYKAHPNSACCRLLNSSHWYHLTRTLAALNGMYTTPPHDSSKQPESYAFIIPEPHHNPVPCGLPPSAYWCRSAFKLGTPNGQHHRGESS